MIPRCGHHEMRELTHGSSLKTPARVPSPLRESPIYIAVGMITNSGLLTWFQRSQALTQRLDVNDGKELYHCLRKAPDGHEVGTGSRCADRRPECGHPAHERHGGPGSPTPARGRGGALGTRQGRSRTWKVGSASEGMSGGLPDVVGCP